MALKKKKENIADQIINGTYDARKNLKENVVQNTNIVERVQQRANNIMNKSSNTISIRNNELMKTTPTLFQSNKKQNELRRFDVNDTLNKRVGRNVGNIVSNFGLGVKKAGESALSYIESASNNNFDSYKRYNETSNYLKQKEEESRNIFKTNNKNEPVKFDIKNQELYNNNNKGLLSRIKENQDLIKQKDTPINQFLNQKINKDEEKIQKNIEGTSDRVSRKIAELMPSIGQSVAGMGVSAINPGLGLAFWQSSAGGDYIKDAKARGMNDEDAFKYGTIMGAMESATEWVGAELAKGVKNAVAKDGVVKGLKALGLDIGENFFEEAIMEPIQESVASMTGGKETSDWNDMKKRMLQSGIDGALTSIIMGGASAGIGKATNLVEKAQAGKTITQEEIADVLKEINKQEEIDIEKVLVDSFGFKAQDLYIDPEAQKRNNQRLENVAGGILQDEAREIIKNSNLSEESKASLLRVAEKHNMSTEEVQNLINNPPNEQVSQNNQQVIQTDTKTAQNRLSQETEGIEQKVLNLRQSIDNYNNSRAEGQEIFDINNEETRKEIEAIQKVVEDRNINIRFDENRFKDNSQNAFYEYDENGNVANIILNPNATTKKYVENLAIHELVHSFCGDQKANLMKDVLNYAKTLEGYDKAYQDIKSNYEKVYGKNVSEDVINEEVVANILGEKLGNKEFVNDLVNVKYSTQNRNFVQKIYDFVKNQINKFKGYKNQEQYWTHIKELFDDAYRNSEVSQEGIKASVERNITDNKQKQLDIIKESNPMTDEYHTGIRTIDDIKTFEEAIQDEESFVYGDYSKEDAERDLKNGTVTVYSSKPIEQGGFVSTSKNMAKDYAGNGQVYSQKVNINDVAWINGDEGQYAKIEQTSTKDSQGRELSKGQQEYFKDSKVRDENENLIPMYHGTPTEDFNIFDKNKISSNTGNYGFFGDGFYFTQLSEEAKHYGKNIKEVYINITNPFNIQEITDLSQYIEVSNLVNLNNEWGKIYTNWKESSTWQDIANDVKKLKAQGLSNSEIDSALYDKYGELPQSNYTADGVLDRLYTESKKNNYLTLSEFLKTQNYDGIITGDISDKNTETIAFEPNQIKNVDNTNPTTNNDIRYSVDTEDLKTDSQGRELSKGQQEYFKNVSPELKDENGNLKRFYHGTNSDFTVFDLSKGGQSNSGASIGFWFTETKEGAEKFANDVWYGDKKPNTKEVYLDIKNPKIYENVKNEEQEQFYKDKSEELEKKAKELKKKYSWDNTDYKTAMTFDSLIRDYHYARIKNESVDLDMFERLAEGRGFSKEQISEMKNDATEYDKIIAESKEAENEYYKLRYNDAYEQFKIDLYEVAGQSAEEANTGGLGMALNNPKETVEKFRQKLIAEGYDGIIIKRTQFDKGSFNGENNQYVIFNSNQAKNIDNTNPTTNPDIRYSQDTTGAWNNFIEKYFKNEGTGTAIKDMKKLPEMSITKYQEVLDNAKHIPQEEKTYLLETVKDIKRNKTSLEDFKNTIETMEKAYDEQNENILDTKKTYNTGRREIYQKYMKAKGEYDTSSLDNAKEIIPANKQGRRTKSQWLNIAKQIGTEIADKSNAEIEEIAYRTWQDERPSNKDSLNRQGEKFVQFTSDEWINTIYDAVKEQREKYSLSTDNNNELEDSTTKNNRSYIEENDTNLDEDLQAIRENSIENIIDGKSRKHYKTYSKSLSLSAKDRQQAQKLYYEEKYMPVGNVDTLTKANERIKRNGIDTEYASSVAKFNNNEKMTLEDVVTMERMIQMYSSQGDYKKVNNLMQNVAILGTELGQRVQALSIIKKMSPEGRLQMLRKLVDRTNQKENSNLKITDEQAERILKSNGEKELNDNVSKVVEEVAEDLKVTLGDEIRGWRYLSMLGNPRTHIRNLVGNVAMNGLQNIKNKVAGAGEDVASKFNPNLERTKTLRRANQDQRDFAKIDAFKMEDDIDGGGKYDMNNLLQNAKRSSNLKPLNALEKFNSNLLDKEDKIFLRKAYEQAMRGYMVANNLSSKDMDNSKTLEKARKYATKQAQEATFHQYSALASHLNQLEKKGGAKGFLTSAILPFKKTPINIAKTGVEYSPVGIFQAIGNTVKNITKDTNNYKSQLEKGKITQEQYNTAISEMVNSRIDQMAKGLTGTSIALIGYALAKNGIIKAGNGDDEDKFEEKLGNQTYSVKIGDQTFSLDWLAPSAIPLFVGANLSNLVNGSDEDSEGEEDTLSKFLNSSVTSMAQAFEPMTEMSMLQGVASAISSYERNSTDKIFNIIASAGQSYGGQFVPTALGQVTKTIDPVIRDTTSTKKGLAKNVDQLVNQTKSKIPGLSQTLPAKVNVWGEDKKRPENVLVRFLENAILPYNREKIIEDTTSEKLKEVYETTGEKGALPGATQKQITINSQKYNLNNKEFNQSKRVYGNVAKKTLDKVVNAREFKKLDSDMKLKFIQDVYSYAKEEFKSEYANNKNIEFEHKVSNSKKKYNAFKDFENNQISLEELIKTYYTEK